MTLDRHTPATTPPASPFLKWVGGKGRLLDQLLAHVPASWETYHEPFLGGGAMFFRLAPERAVLSDMNPRLVECWQVVRDQPHALIDRLAHHRSRHNPHYYYEARTRFNHARNQSAVDRAALFIYLNKTCFNGLYRENRRGEFNVPAGSYRDPSVFQESQLLAVHEVLQGVEILHGGFQGVLDRAQPGDLVYFDPPYVPLSATSSFTGYVQGGFDLGMQQELARLFFQLSRRGCAVMLSNSDCEVVRELYRGWRMERVMAPRAINARGDRRGAIPEVLVCSW
jgi:DNA adenine methylase